MQHEALLSWEPLWQLLDWLRIAAVLWGAAWLFSAWYYLIRKDQP